MELLQFIKEYKFHLYHDGTWYTNHKRDWRKPQKFYTDQQLFDYYKKVYYEKN